MKVYDYIIYHVYSPFEVYELTCRDRLPLIKYWQISLFKTFIAVQRIETVVDSLLKNYVGLDLLIMEGKSKEFYQDILKSNTYECYLWNFQESNLSNFFSVIWPAFI